ncbi:MAG: hypothetical protein HC857_01985 [Synechococcales cyanobacterium RU_4_20]|nr:hypothetical protein [Synechococcales cyanobacterium RU_4_20]
MKRVQFCAALATNAVVLGLGMATAQTVEGIASLGLEPDLENTVAQIEKLPTLQTPTLEAEVTAVQLN